MSPGGLRREYIHLRPSVNVNQRRSQRILLTGPIVISGISSNNAVFSERTSTLVVNAHGALIQLREHVVAGQKLRMRNSATSEEISCAVMDINPGNAVIPEVGVQFSAPNPHFCFHRQTGRRAALRLIAGRRRP
jgi:hypothetical protein